LSGDGRLRQRHEDRLRSFLRHQPDVSGLEVESRPLQTEEVTAPEAGVQAMTKIELDRSVFFTEEFAR
jgi:hypothetical protein